MAVAAGWLQSLGLKAGGSVVAWGRCELGQCNLPAPNTGFIAIAGCGSSGLGLEASYGDLNCDGVIDFDDISPFVHTVGADPLTWNLAHPRCHWLNADCDGNGYVDFGDINPFMALLVDS